MIENKTYNINTEVFQGPFDLLLSLIAKHEIDIYDISISEIAEEYLSYINKMKELDLEVASEFLLIAATLLEIKSARLLPVEKEEIVDELTPEQIKRELIKRLINYRKFKNAVTFLESRIDKGMKYHPRAVELEGRFLELIPDFTDKINPQHLAKTMVRIIQRYYLAYVDASHITPIPISMEEQINFLQRELDLKGFTSFKKLTGGFSRMEIIVTFLAVLELYKEGQVDIGQPEKFGDIVITGNC